VDLEPPSTVAAPPNVGSQHPPAFRLRSPLLRVRGKRALAVETVRVEGLARSEPVSDLVRG